MKCQTIYLGLFGLFLLLQSCGSGNEQAPPVGLNARDQAQQTVFNFQHRQELDSLVALFASPDANQRYLAAMAFSSIKSEEAIEPLRALLAGETHPQVREAAVFALGQTGSPQAVPVLIKTFDQLDTLGKKASINAAILEAIGRCGGADELRALSTVTTYTPGDSILIEGQAWGIYRFALRSIILPEGTGRMWELVSNPAYSNRIRFIAANYFYRAPEIDIDTLSQPIAQMVFTEKDPLVRIPLAIALGKTGQPEARAALVQLYSFDKDYRVRTNVIRALSNFAYEDVRSTIFRALRDESDHVAIAAADFFLENGQGEDVSDYWNRAKTNRKHWKVATTLYAAAQRHLSLADAGYREILNNEVRKAFQESVNPYEKADLLKALAEFGWNFRYIYREGFQHENPVIRTAAAQALASVSDKENFRRYFGQNWWTFSRELAMHFKEAVESEDVALVTIGANALRNPDRDMKSYFNFRDSSFLENALTKLNLPREMGAYQALQQTIAAYNETEPAAPPAGAYYRPIQWPLIENLPSDARVLIETTRGEIELELLPNLAPETVANFIQLVTSGFYEGRSFHRVVPNFVIQTGCPRGDGYGSLDYRIRSELPKAYYDEAGYVGMASSGNHTECTQFFITHSPTPHLDGNYTIFARVTRNMNIVHDIQIGDQIKKITIL